MNAYAANIVASEIFRARNSLYVNTMPTLQSLERALRASFDERDLQDNDRMAALYADLAARAKDLQVQMEVLLSKVGAL